MQEEHSQSSPFNSFKAMNINHHSQSISEHEEENETRSEGRWNENEHLLFIKGLFEHGKNWKEIETLVGTRMCSQVRSHAQKFFIKLTKIVKDRKKQKNKIGCCLSEIELEILDHFTVDDITKNTPEILIAVINDGDSVTRNSRIVKEKKTKEIEKCNETDDKISLEQKGEKNEKIRMNRSHEGSEGLKDDNKILNESCLDSYYEHQYEDKSFFRKLMENNVEIFQKGREFTDLIDFEGHNHEEGYKHEDFESSETRLRKSSFTLVDDLQNNERLKEALHKVKTGASYEK